MTDSPSPSPQPAPPDWDALARRSAGESSEAEARELAAWLAEHPGDAALLEALDGVAGRVTAPPTLSDAEIGVEAALARVQARRDEPKIVPLRPKSGAASRGARARWRLPLGLAAAAAAVVAVAVGRRGNDAAAEDSVASAASASSIALAAPGQTVVTAVGVRDSVRLPDGSRVVLAPGSRLAVATGYGATAREVTLEGQALFTVQHDAARPFAVHAGSALVRDLGTVFSVRTDGVGDRRGGASGVAVVVTEGRVALGAAAGDSAMQLDAGDRGELRPSGALAAERGVVTPDDVAWARGSLVYRAAPFATVAADLRRWYGVELRAADPAVAARRLTASFAGEPADRVLSVVALALGAELTREGGVATLRPAGRPSGTGAR